MARGVRWGPPLPPRDAGPPYSDLDWLDLNLSRVRNPELRPSTNNSIGRVAVKDPEGQLLPKTDRIGFIENESFQELRRFAIDAGMGRRTPPRTTRAATVGCEGRVGQGGPGRQENSGRDGRDSSDQGPTAAQEGDHRFRGCEKREENLLREDLQLYRTLCTVGATAAAFAHQSKSPLAHIASSAGTLEDYLRKGDGGTVPRVLKDMAAEIRSAADSLLSFAKVTLACSSTRSGGGGRSRFTP